jgi:Fe-S-cluster containining protein
MRESIDLRRQRPSGGLEASIEPVPQAGFRFSCHKGVPCFTHCCRDLDLRLTPYDLLRMRRSLQVTSTQLLEAFTDSEVDERWGIPVVRLRMNEDAVRSCPFVTQQGCSIYADRPGACRSYPLGRAARRAAAADSQAGGTEERYFLVREPHCLGYREGVHWTIEAWKADQGLGIYNSMNDRWLAFVSGRAPWARYRFSPQQWKMFYTACYSIDGFRRFVFESTLLRLVDLDEEEIARLKASDEELLGFAFRWLSFCLFGERCIPLK